MEITPIPDTSYSGVAPTYQPPALTSTGLAAELRGEVARQQCWLLPPAGPPPPNRGEQPVTNPATATVDQPLKFKRGGSRRPFVDWVQISANFKWAQQQAAGIGQTLPELKRFSGIKRRVLRFMARCILVVSRVIINPQRALNLTLLNSLNDLANALRVVEQGQRTVVNHLENEVAVRLRELENTVNRLQAELCLQQQRVHRGEAA